MRSRRLWGGHLESCPPHCYYHCSVLTVTSSPLKDFLFFFCITRVLLGHLQTDFFISKTHDWFCEYLSLTVVWAVNTLDNAGAFGGWKGRGQQGAFKMNRKISLQASVQTSLIRKVCQLSLEDLIHFSLLTFRRKELSCQELKNLME